jgi:TatD DNase family protein
MGKKTRPPIPYLDGKIIETHCHLDYLSKEELVSTLRQSRAVGVEKIITIAVSRDNQSTVRENRRLGPQRLVHTGLAPT